MAATVENPRPSALEQSWWLRAPAVLVAPRPVFVALRDDSEEAAENRQEPLIALLCFASIAAVLGTSAARTILNEGGSSLIVPIWAFVGGAFYALAVYWAGGGLLFGAARRLGGVGSFRRARNLVALASAPLALTLFTLWPIRIAVYGENLFRTGGDDYGRGDTIFGAVYYGILAWSIYLLVVGVRSVHGWTWGRALAVVGLAAAFPALIVLATSL